jgi:hypothetical protein
MAPKQLILRRLAGLNDALDEAEQRRKVSGRRAEWLLAATSALSVLALAAAAEVALRATRPAFLRHTRVDHPHVYSQTYGWELRRGARYEGRDGEIITVNRLGYRGREHAAGPHPGIRRVVMLGDSVTFGTGVSDGETFSDRLETAAAYEVVNLGVDGYGTDQELIRLENEGFSYRPDDVVLSFCVRNDYFDNALPVALYDGVSRKPYFTLDGDRLVRHDEHLKIGRATRVAEALNEGSYLVNALLLLGGRRRLVAGAGRNEGDWGDRRAAVERDFPRAVALTLRLVEEIAAQCRRENARFLVVVHPDHRAFAGDSALITPLEGLAGVRVVDLRLEYRARGLAYEDLALDRLGHLNAAGHVAAAGILRTLLEK